MKADLGCGPLAAVAFAAVRRNLGERPIERVGDYLAELERGARGRVDLVAMMDFDDLDVITIAEDARRGLRELVSRVHANGEIRRHDDGHALRRLADCFFLRLRKTGGS